MLRFLVFSDSHGTKEPMLELYNRYPNDGIIHLGDYIADARWMLERTNGHPVYMVKGNCDFTAQGLEEQILELGGVRILLFHGHRQGVKSGYGAALAVAKQAGAQVVLFGHTHTPFMEEREGILIMNPGALSSPFRNYGILEIEDQKAKGALLQQYE